MKKKLIATLVALALVCAGMAFAEETLPTEATGSLQNLVTVRSVVPVEDEIGLQEEELLVVASPTQMSGYFAMDLWGNNTADIDVRNLLHGYSTIAWFPTSELMFNGAAVATVQAALDAAGNRTYTFHLMTDIVYNDGTPVTAKDYLFSLLLCASPLIEELGGQPRGIAHFVGYDAYQKGLTSGISGIRLLSDDSFSLTVDGAYLPYFYGLALLDITPYPMHVIAPGCDILDAGDGAYIGRGADAAEMNEAELGFAPGVFSAQMLAKTLLDPETGYVFNPKVTCGPYSLESYDKEAKTASFVINENYYGNYEGQKPHIKRIEFRYIANEDMFAALESGEVDLLNKVMDAATITELRTLSGVEGQASESNYLRTGLAYLALACEDGVTADVAVRQAIARCIDKDALIADLSQFAMAVHGYYGLGQWIMSYYADEDTVKGTAEIDVQLEMEALKAPYDMEESKALLKRAGWAYDAAGGTYTEGVRYRKEADGSLTPLVIRWAKPVDSAQTVNMIHAYLEAAFAEIGISLEVTEMTFAEMLPHFYRNKPRTYDMFFLGSNFLDVFDPYYDYNTADIYQGAVNTSGLKDEELMALAWDMRTTQAAERQEYAHKWLAFQERWIEMMPLVPLYSNVYFDFYTNYLQDYNVTETTSWALSIPYAWIGEPAPVEEGGFLMNQGGFQITPGNAGGTN